VREAGPIAEACGVRLDDRGRLDVVTGSEWVRVDPDRNPSFAISAKITAPARQMLDLYLPLCIGAKSKAFVLGHVGQSLDGQIATASGASRYVSGHEDLVHMHRLRALCDAVVVGANTVEYDDPQLTTRLASGTNPVRVVIDPRLRLPATRRLFQDDGVPTLIVHASGTSTRTDLGHAEFVSVPTEGDLLPPSEIIDALARRGLRRLLIEGGGVTVSRFLAARALDRIQVAICPVLIGQGRPGLVLPPIERLEQAVRVRPRRFLLGDDVLFDCDLEGSGSSSFAG
jgi:riboflavin-specific deaminase-like protein